MIFLPMRSLVLALVLLLAPLLEAATYFVPPDAELIQRSDDIVIATGVASLQNAHQTEFTLRIERVLKGERSVGEHLVLTERGGRNLLIPGAPHYDPGRRYLVFTETDSHGEPITFGMSLGAFELEHGRARRHGITGFDRNLEPHVERERNARAFLDYIDGIVAQRIPLDETYFADATTASLVNVTANLTRASYLLEGAYRWDGVPNANYAISGSAGAGYDGIASAMTGVNEWNATDSNIELSVAGQNDAALGGLEEPDGIDTILLGDPNNELPSSVAARGGAWGDYDYTFAGENFVAIVEADVVFNHPFTAGTACFNTVMTHEIGHTLGIRHSNQSPDERACTALHDCETDAIMRAAVVCALNGVLRPWDKRAAAAVYGAGPPPPCFDPELQSYSESKTIKAGESVTLSMTATGTGPLTLQWYRGDRGDRSQPVGTGATVTVSPNVTTKYWARAGNACGQDSSPNITITVEKSSKRRRSVRS